MELTKDTTFEVGWLTWQLRPPQPSLTLVVKGTFAIVPGAACTLAKTQELPTGDTSHDGDDDKGLRFESDYAIFKPRAECLLAGTCHPPGGRAAVSAVAFRVGPVKKSLAIFGNRAWKLSLLGRAPDPEPFESMPLCWERAFGGPGFDANPVGRGIADLDTPEGRRRPLPNIEDPGDLVTEKGSRPRPAGFGPIPRTWKSRVSRAGTYDARWLKTRWPWFPEDFDWDYYLASPPDQRIDGYFRGDEEIGLRNLHRAHPLIDTRLPGIVPRCFLSRSGGLVSGLEEVPLRLDTITVDADRMLVFCLWRGVTEVASDACEDVERVFVVETTLAERRPIESYAEHLAEVLARDEGAFDLTDVEPPDDELPAADRATMIDDGASARIGDEAPPPPDPIAEKIAALDAKLRSLGILVDAEPPKPRPPPGPEQFEKMQSAFRKAGIEPPAPLLELIASLREKPSPAVEEEPRPSMVTPLSKSREIRKIVKQRLRADEPIAGMDLTGADLSGMDLSDLDLTGVILTEANLRSAYFDRSKLLGANLDRANLQGAYVRDAFVAQCSMVDARAEVVTFDGSTLDSSDFTRALMTSATFGGCSIRGALFRETLLYAAVFDGARLDESDFGGAAIEEVQMRGASLRDVHLEGAWALRIVMDDADLSGFRAFGETVLEHASFKRAKAAGSQWQGASLTGANFSFADLTRADFSGAVLHAAILHGANLSNARLEHCVLADLAAMDANLFETNLEGADLSHADLRGSNLFGAEVWQAHTDGIQLELANVARTKLARS